ncbi:hypothetical protein DSL92_09045, partial [Billgrantia gudaonensis]
MALAITPPRRLPPMTLAAATAPRPTAALPEVTIDTFTVRRRITRSAPSWRAAQNATSVDVTVTGPDGFEQTFNDVAVTDGNWSVDLGDDVAPGDYTATATATDDAGNSDSATADSGFTLPEVTIDTFTVTSADN